MSYKSDPDQPVKFCFVCRTHFYAPPDEHEEEYHDDSEWLWQRGKVSWHHQYIGQ